MTHSREYGSNTHKERASAWFGQLRDELCAALEAVEDDVNGPNRTSGKVPGRFELKVWERSDEAGKPGGGGVMCCLMYEEDIGQGVVSQLLFEEVQENTAFR